MKAIRPRASQTVNITNVCTRQQGQRKRTRSMRKRSHNHSRLDCLSTYIFTLCVTLTAVCLCVFLK